MRLTEPRIAWILVAIFFVAAIAVFFRALDIRYTFDLATKSKTDIEACAKQKILAFDKKPADAFGLLQINQLCYAQLADEQNLGNMEINKIKYLQQNYWDQVILWMVVVITVSGVALAAMQLLASYNLSMKLGTTDLLDQQAQMAFEGGKISIRSSITGLLILVVSLIFFFVYIKFVYTIDEPGRRAVSRGESEQTSAAPQSTVAESHFPEVLQGTIPELEPGGLGKAPASPR